MSKRKDHVTWGREGHGYTSVGQFDVFADVRGSYGEIVHTQIGRRFQDVEAAIGHGERFAAKHGVRNVIVRNRTNGWQYTVVV